jgi:PAS domain S-box-containing protein
MDDRADKASRTDEFALIADAAPVPMWVTGLDRRRRFVNRAYGAFLGCDYARAIEFDWRTILHPDDAGRIVAESLAGEASLRPFTLEGRYRGGDGAWHWLRSVSQPRFDADGAHIGFIGVAHDVTAAKTAEMASREREAQLSALIEQTDAGLSQVDLAGRFTLVNNAFCAIVGRSRDTLLGTPMQQITHPDDLTGNAALFATAVRDGTPYRHEKRYVRPDGSNVWVNNSVSLIRRADGEPYGVLAVTLDVTARLEAEAAVRANEARLAFLDALGSGTASAADADAVLAITTRLLGERLELSDCAYADVEPDQDTFHIRGDWHADDAPSIVGTYSLATFGSLAVANLRSGRPLVVNDNIAELGDDGAQAFVDIGIRATICMPLVKGGRLTALMAIHAAEPRVWSDAELALLREVTDRSWAHIERVRSQAALRESDERLRLAIEGARIGTWDWDLPAGLGTWSDRTCEIMGVDPGLPVTPELRYSLIHPEDRIWMLAAVAQLQQDGGEFGNEYRVVRPDGEVRWVASRGIVLRAANGAVVRMTGTIRDVTARRAAQDALAALNRTLEDRIAARTAERDRMWRLSRDLFVVVGRRRDILAVNPALAALGYREDEVIGRPLDEFLHPDDRREARDVIRRAGRGPVGEFFARVRTAAGEWRCFSWSAAPGEGEAYVIGRDVTVDMQRRDELDLAREALRQAQKVEALGQLTGGVAHDFNNLLTPIIGNLDLLQRVPLGDGSRLRRLAAAALESAERARTLVQRLLAFARRQPLRPCPVDLAALIHGMAGLIASTSGPQVHVLIDAADDLPPALADANQLEMAMLNLSVNARDAMPDGGTLTLRADHVAADDPACRGLPPGRYLRLAVSDSGMGMDEATRERAIEPFFSTKGAGKGTGLGLSMVHGLASQLGGAMTLDSRPGLGTTVALLLPVADRESEHAAPAEAGTDAAPGAGTVLLVDDDVPVRATTAEMLGDLGFAVIATGSAEEALSVLGDRRPDYLVTDHIMPGMNGADLARAALRMHPALPVLVVSGYAELDGIPPDLPRLAKPFRVDELAACMTALA